MGYFSNQASIEARISALRLAGFLDRNKDGDPDPAALLSIQRGAKGKITSYICKEYSSDTIDAWDIDDVDNQPPLIIGTISDDLCIYLTYWNNPKFQELAITIRDNAIADLERIRNREMDIYEVTRDEIESSTSRMTYLECSDSEAAAGECDPCAYEYI